MDLKLFFDPIADEIKLEEHKPNSVYSALSINRSKLPDLDGIDMAIIGLQEVRGGSKDDTGMVNAPVEVRKKLYELKKGTGRYRIVDLGNLRNGPQLEDTHLRLKEVCAYLIDKNILPIIIGGTHDFTWPQYLGYESMDKLVSVINIDPKFDLDESDTANQSHLHQLFTHEPNYLFGYSHIAQQSYLVDEKENELMESLYFDAFRLGVVKENLKEMEPIIRNGDMLTFDLSAIKSAYCPGTANRLVYGLTGEEACQLCWYAGINDKLSSIGFYEFDPTRDNEDGQTAFVLATMIWYFIEGYYHRKNENIFRSNDYLVYEVSMSRDDPSTIRFFKSKLSEKWWMEVPYPGNDLHAKRNVIVPCSYSDYETAGKGELPERWIGTQNKMI